MTFTKVPAPWQGINEVDGPDSLANGQSPSMLNMLPGRPARLLLRGPVDPPGFAYTPPAPYSDALGPGAWVSGDQTSAALLYPVSATQVRSTRSGGAVAVAGALSLRLSNSHARMEGYTVGPTAGWATAPLLCWTESPAQSFVSVTNGPVQCQAVASHLTRVFALAGSVPGTTTPVLNNRLYWTDPNPDLRTNTLALWQDDVTGLVNQIPLPANDFYRDIVVFNRVLYIIGERTVYALVGDTPASFSLRRVSDVGSPLGVAGHACTTDRGLYLWTAQGLARFDGATMSYPAAGRLNANWWGRRTYQQMTVMPAGYISVILNGRWLIFHEASGAWADMQATAFPFSSRPSAVRQVSSSTYHAINLGDVGGAVSGDLRDVSSLTAPEAYSAGYTVTPAAFAVSQTVVLAPFPQRAAVRRLHVQSYGGDWTVQAQTEDGTVQGNPIAIAGTTAPRDQTAGDIIHEGHRVRVRWTNVAGSPGLAPSASIGDAWIEADSAQQR